MNSKSFEGLTFEFVFDWVIIFLTIVGPFILPRVAKLGTSTRIPAGIILINLGVFMGWGFYGSLPLDPDKHWVLVYTIEFISYLLLPFSLILFIILPPLYIWLGIRILLGLQSKR